MKSPTRKTALLITAAVALLVALTVALLRTPLVVRLAMERAQAYLHDNYGIDLSAGHADIDVARGTLWMRDVLAKSAAYPDLPAILRVDDASVNFSVFDLLRGRIHVQSARLTGLALNVVVAPDGRNNLPSIEQRAPFRGLPPFVVDSLTVERASLSVDDRQKDRALELPEWSLRIMGTSQPLAHELRMRLLRAGIVRAEARTVSIEQFDAVAAVSRTDVQTSTIAVRIGGSSLQMRGAVRDLGDPVLDLSFDSVLDLPALSRLAQTPEQVGGTLRVSGRVAGKPSALVVSGHARGDGISTAGYDRVRLETDYRFRSGDPRLEIENLDIFSPYGRVQARGAAALTPELRSSIEGRIEDWDLAPLGRFLDKSVRVASRATARFAVSWSGMEVASVSGFGRLQLVPNRQAAARGLLPLGGAVVVRARPGQIDATLEALSLLGARISGSATLRDGSRISGEITGDVAAVDRFQDQLQSLLGRPGALLPIQLAGRAAVSARLAGTMSAPSAEGTIESSDLAFGRLRNLALTAHAYLDPARLLIRDAVANMGGQVLRIAGTVGFGGRDPVLDLEAALERGSIVALLAAADLDVPMNGTIEARARVAGPLGQLQGDAHVSATGLVVGGETLGTFGLDAILGAGTLRTTRAVLQKTAGDEAAGYMTADASYDVESGIFAFNAAAREFWLPQRLPVGGSISGTAAGQGTVQDPVIDLKLEIPDMSVRGESVGNASLTAALRGDDGEVRAELPRLNLSANGKVQARSPFPAELHVEARDLDLSLLRLPVADGQVLAGRIDAAATGTANLKEWKAGEVSVVVRKANLVARSRELRNDGPVQARYQRGTLEIDEARLVTESSSLVVAGTIALDREAPRSKLTLKGALEIGDLQPFFESPPGFFASGLLKFDMALEGTPAEIGASGGFSMSDGFLHVPQIRLPLTDIAIDGSLGDGAVQVRSAESLWGAGRITYAGEIPLGLLPRMPFRFERKQGAARFELTFSNPRLEATEELPAGVGGSLDLQVRGELGRPDLESLRAVATSNRLQLTAGELVFEQPRPATITVRDGTVRVDNFALQGPGSRVAVSGTAGLLGEHPLDLRVDGDVDAGIFSVFSSDLRLTGTTRLEVAVKGTTSAPAVSGFAQLQDGEASVRSLRLGADDLNVKLGFAGNRMTVQTLAGTLNGGTLSGTGTLDYKGTTLTGLNLGARLDGVYVGYPEGLRAIVNGNLNIKSTESPIVVGGTILVQEGSYTEPSQAGGLFGALSSKQVLDVSQKRDPVLSRIRYNVAVRTVDPVSVSTGMAKLAASGNLRLVGTYYNPSIVGRATFDEGGELRLNERQYVLDQGSISFVNENRIEPVLDIEGRTEVAGYDINLALTGTPENPKTALTSDPPLPEPDILSLLLTGRTQEEFRGEELEFAKEQALSLVAGEAGARISQGAQRVLGLSTVRIEPNLISPESDPGARLTVGQNLTNDLRLIYSMNLVNSNDQIWIGEYDVTRRFVTRALKQQDNSYRFEFQHDLRFGGSASTGRVRRFDRTKREVGTVSFKGGTALGEKRLQSRLNFKSGDRYDFTKVQKAREDLRGYFASEGRLESKVSVSRSGEDGKVDLAFAVTPGPRVRFFFDGDPAPRGAAEKVASVWSDGVFDLQRVQDAVQAIRRSLIAEGYLQSDVRYRIEQEGEAKDVHFTIRRGATFHDVQLVFSGNSDVESAELRHQIVAAKLENAVYNDPSQVVDLLANYYRTQGYTHAKVESPKLDLNPSTGSGRVEIPIKEGPRFRIGQVVFQGNTLSDDTLRRASALGTGTIFAAREVDGALERIDRFYHSRGYNDATFDYETLLDDSTGLAEVRFRIEERRRTVIQSIVVQGNERTPTSFVRKQLSISEGEILDPEAIARSRRALYDTGVFTLVDFDTQPADAVSPAGNTKRVDITVKLREVKPYRFRYGGFYDTDRGAGFTGDISNRNFLGRAAVVGLHTRYDGTMKEARTYFGQPFTFGIPLQTNVTAFVQRESRPAYTLDRVGASLVQEKQLHDRYILNYGYRYERVKAPQGLPDPLLRFTSMVPLARLTASITGDTRDDMLDATRGSFHSQALEYAPGLLGGDARFVKYFGQYFRYVPLSRPQRLSSGRVVPRFVYAGALRIGLSKGLGGQEVITPERFFAGGGTTMRGFRQDRLGPLDENGRPEGGEAMFLLNNEVRLPLFAIFGGVGFVDIGNVYPSVRDFNPFDVRKSAGVGLRVRTGYVVIRADYGVKLDRRTGESRGALFFSIGQAY